MKILLVSNYELDRQQSMLRFAALLQEGLRSLGHHVETARPSPVFGRYLRHRKSVAKWAGYLDKLVLFPHRLARWSARFDVAHVCDHSNAPYRPWLRSRSVVATCHDLLAVRGALGEATYCPASGLGRRLQTAILKNLASTPHVACDSDATRADFSRLTGRLPGSSLRTIRLGFCSTFRRPPEAELRSTLASLNLCERPYVLHVGSSQARKNREGVLNTVAQLGHRWAGQVVFAGEKLKPSQMQMASALGLTERIRDFGEVSDATLASLYAGAHAFLFPSYCEGFGWPILEAQACACPVITADNTSLKEVAGNGAMVFPANDVGGMAEAVLQVEDPQLREEWIARGIENLQRFTLEKMVGAYESLYQEALRRAG